MATFEKKTWVDRVSEFPTRRTLTDVSTGTAQIVTVSRTEGEITNPGDAFNAQNMNDLENRIDAVVTDMNTNFQAGVDAVYNACVAAGLTPSASTPEAIAAAISTVGGATAVASDIRYGKKAFSQNQMLNGTFQAEEKTITASRNQQIVTPSNASRWLSKVTVNKYPDANGIYPCGSNNGAAASNDMGWNNNYRYVDATNVYSKGYSDAQAIAWEESYYLYDGGNFISLKNVTALACTYLNGSGVWRTYAEPDSVSHQIRNGSMVAGNPTLYFQSNEQSVYIETTGTDAAIRLTLYRTAKPRY